MTLGLPEPPTDRERTLYVKRRLSLLVFLSIASFAGITYGLVRLSLAMWWGPVLLAYCAAILLTFLLSLISNYSLVDFDLAAHDDFAASWDFDGYPSIDIWLPNCGEPQEILANTWTYVSQITWPGTVNVYCLDDGGLDRVRELAEHFGFHYLSRPDKPWMKKSGNLRYAYQHSSGDVIFLLDADFCPRPSVLLETVPYLLADPDIGIVQTAQYFRIEKGQNWIARGGAQLQEFFYRAAQWSRQQHAASICCGTNAIYRRAALDENGGMTLIPQGEDMRTGFDLGLLGWRMLYMPLILAAGICPDDVPSYFKQQYRWCTGSLRLLVLPRFWHADLALRQRLCYIAGFTYYLVTALYTMVIPAVVVTLLAFYPSSFRIVNYIVLLPAMFFILVVYPLWHRSPYGPSAWSAKIVCQWSYIFAIWDFLFEQTIPWDATGSGSTTTTSSSRFRQFVLASITWNGLTSALWFSLSLYHLVATGWERYIFATMMGIFYVVNSLRVIVSVLRIRQHGGSPAPPPLALATATVGE